MSINKVQYSKGKWKEIAKRLKKGEAKRVIDAALLEAKGRRAGRVLLFDLKKFITRIYCSIK